MVDDGRKKILIVDDDEGLQFVVTKRLRSAGFECASAQTVEAGLKMCKEWNPDMIVLDLGFMGNDGADFLQSVRQWAPNGQPPPVLVLSCYSDQDIIDYVMDMGATGFISKPYDAKQLIDHINGCIST